VYVESEVFIILLLIGWWLKNKTVILSNTLKICCDSPFKKKLDEKNLKNYYTFTSLLKLLNNKLTYSEKSYSEVELFDAKRSIIFLF
jgi:hypothetical protein